jgi:hypothetical protein
MCFVIDRVEESSARIAKRDMVCYKVFSKYSISKDKKRVKSLYQSFKYDFGYEYYQTTPIVSSGNTIGEGLHSYSVKRKAKLIATWRAGGVILPCVIPKGTRYYYNSIRKEYVSEAIIIGNYKDLLTIQDIK